MAKEYILDPQQVAHLETVGGQATLYKNLPAIVQEALVNGKQHDERDMVIMQKQRNDSGEIVAILFKLGSAGAYFVVREG